MSDHDIAMRPFSQSLPMALLRARESTMRLFRPMLATHDLTEQQWRVLRALAAADQPLEVGEVAARTFLLGPSLSRILANLEARTLVRRRLASHDQRRSQLSLTAAGHRLVRRIAPTSEATYEAIEAHFGKDRLSELLTLLDELAHIDSALASGSDNEGAVA